MAEPVYIRLPDAGWPLIELGFGLVEVAEGRQPVERVDGTKDERPALIFGRNGSGKVGDPLTPDRQMLPGEPLAVVTFANVESLDVVLGKLQIIRERMTAGVPPSDMDYGNNMNVEVSDPAGVHPSQGSSNRDAGRQAHKEWERTRGNENECDAESRLRHDGQRRERGRDWWEGWFERSDEWRDEIGHDADASGVAPSAPSSDPGAMWDRFIASIDAQDGITHKNLLGGIGAYRAKFVAANACVQEVPRG